MGAISVVGNSLKTVWNSGLLKAQKYSPEILMVAGIAGVVSAAVLACRATLKCEEVKKDYQDKMEKVEYAKANFDPKDYTEEDHQKDILIVKTQTILKYAKLYAPAITLGVASLVCICASHGILRKRNAAIMAAYKLVEESFSKYRERVREELGADKDWEFKNGPKVIEMEKTVTDEEGNERIIAAHEVSGPGSMYARLFEPYERINGITWNGSASFSQVNDYNINFLKAKQNHLNDRLNAEGFVFLNDVYDELGFPKTKAGQAVGWLKGSKGKDNYISFGPCMEALLGYNNGDPILLDFNVDGVIWDQI